jgi:hypothetical protein
MIWNRASIREFVSIGCCTQSLRAHNPGIHILLQSTNRHLIVCCPVDNKPTFALFSGDHCGTRYQPLTTAFEIIVSSPALFYFGLAPVLRPFTCVVSVLPTAKTHVADSPPQAIPIQPAAPSPFTAAIDQRQNWPTEILHAVHQTTKRSAPSVFLKLHLNFCLQLAP